MNVWTEIGQFSLAGVKSGRIGKAIESQSLYWWEMSTDLSPASPSAAGRVHLPAAAAPDAAADEEPLGEEGEGGEERRPAQRQQHRVHHAPRRLGREHRRPGNNLYGA